MTNVWLNGTQILTDDATSWTPNNPTILYLGTSHAISSHYSGDITGFQVYDFLLSAVQIKQILIDSNKKVNDT